MPHRPKITLGTAASISIDDDDRAGGAAAAPVSVRKSAVATPSGTAITRAISDETSVPKMNGSAPY